MVGPVIDVLNRDLPVFQKGVLEQAQQLAVVTGVDLPVDQQRHELFVTQCGDTRLGCCRRAANARATICTASSALALSCRWRGRAGRTEVP